MALVTLSKIWFHNAADLSDSIQIDASWLKEDVTARGEVRWYANGRLRAFSRPGTKHSFNISISPCPRASEVWLASFTEKTVLYRDQTGRKYYGVYHSIDVVEAAIDAAWVGRISFRFLEIEKAEGV